MSIRKANINDVNGINALLYQVQDVHANGRPDIFIKGTKKFKDEELIEILNGNDLIFYVYEANKKILGYICIKIIIESESFSKYARKELYIEDLCVDENYRHQGIAKELYDYIIELAKKEGCSHITLNVWELNKNAKEFYKKMGMNPLKTIMEFKL
ncbi:MAG: GNAT family N-acetyltransferase [Erysipelotrichaceae bacterium]|nr:GNAT family N-acetyltransferase [Erysipelotrichaceae bacterium]